MASLMLSMAEKIVITRKRLDETQKQFAARFNVEPLTIANWEKGKIEPRSDQHRALLSNLFMSVLQEEGESQFEIATYQLHLPFNEPVKIDFRVSPHSADRVRLGIEITRKAG